MRHSQRFVSVFRMIAVAAVFTIGCSGREDDFPREPISGTVIYDGKPLKSGTIQFFPASQKEGIASGGPVIDGKFDVAMKEGPVPGKYSVMIFARDENPEPVTAGGEMPGEVQGKKSKTSGLIPLRYNLQTKLGAEVKPDGPNTYAFVLEKN